MNTSGKFLEVSIGINTIFGVINCMLVTHSLAGTEIISQWYPLRCVGVPFLQCPFISRTAHGDSLQPL